MSTAATLQHLSSAQEAGQYLDEVSKDDLYVAGFSGIS